MSLPEEYIEHVPWDSEFFGYKVGTLKENIPISKLAGVLDHCRLNSYKLIYFKTERDEDTFHHSALENKGLLADIKVTYRRPLFKNYSSDIYHIKPAESEIISKELLSIALQTGAFSRFNTDPNFGKEKYEELYTLWLKKSLTKELADEVLLYWEDNLVLGYLALRISQSIGKIILIGVDLNQHRKGIGKMLLKRAVNLCLDMKCESMEVVTQGSNKSACLFFENFGFNIYRKEFIYHFWLK